MNLIETDVIICGAGISGLLMAKSLTNIGLKVTCIEKYKRQKLKMVLKCYKYKQKRVGTFGINKSLNN